MEVKEEHFAFVGAHQILQVDYVATLEVPLSSGEILQHIHGALDLCVQSTEVPLFAQYQLNEIEQVNWNELLVKDADLVYEFVLLKTASAWRLERKKLDSLLELIRVTKHLPGCRNTCADGYLIRFETDNRQTSPQSSGLTVPVQQL